MAEKNCLGNIASNLFSPFSPCLFKDSKLHRIADILKLKLLCFVYEAIKILTPDRFHKFLCLNIPIHCHNKGNKHVVNCILIHLSRVIEHIIYYYNLCIERRIIC